jgi:hypothetical protein
MLHRVEDFLRTIVEEKRTLAEHHLQEVLGKVTHELSKTGQLQTTSGATSFMRKAYEQELEKWADTIVGLLIDTSSLLRLHRDEGLARELYRLFLLWFTPFAEALQSDLFRRSSFSEIAAIDNLRFMSLADSQLSAFSKTKDLAEQEPLDLGDYIRDLEISLRAIVQRRFREMYGNAWRQELIKVMREEVYTQAEKTMSQRRAYSPDDFLHFTQLNDVYDVINQNWPMFKEVFSLLKAEFNRCMQQVVKGRTDQAHNRPPHLFTPIERKRAEVAAYDVLSAIKDGERLLLEARRPYLPYIRATRFLFEERGKELNNLLRAMFKDFDVAIENTIHSNRFSDIVSRAGFVLIIGHYADDFRIGNNLLNVLYGACRHAPAEGPLGTASTILITRDRKFIATPKAAEELERSLSELRAFAAEGAGAKIWD